MRKASLDDREQRIIAAESDLKLARTEHERVGASGEALQRHVQVGLLRALCCLLSMDCMFRCSAPRPTTLCGSTLSPPHPPARAPAGPHPAAAGAAGDGRSAGGG